ncbi:Alpha/Beta hydrolase protein [Syncephalis plumigaleata]|nr:Alpha/Beta hydrolase protein [Syncephalis plumigaleata]
MRFSSSGLFSAAIGVLSIASQFVAMTAAEFCQVAANRTGGPFNMHYEIYGSGPERVMLVTGLGGNLKQSQPQARTLASLGYQVCIIDNRGVGESGAPPGNYTHVEVLEHIGWKSDVHLVGASMGDMLKLLTLSCTVADTTLPIVWLDQPSKRIPGKTNRQVVDELARTSIGNGETDGGNFPGQVAAVMTHLVKHDRLYTIRQAGIPTMVCTGDMDTTNAGHAFGIQEPERYTQVLVSHFEDASKH